MKIEWEKIDNSDGQSSGRLAIHVASFFSSSSINVIKYGELGRVHSGERRKRKKKGRRALEPSSEKLNEEKGVIR